MKIVKNIFRSIYPVRYCRCIALWIILPAFLISNTYAQTFAWAKALNSISHQNVNDIALDINGNIFTIGSFDGITDFDPGVGTYNLTSEGASDVFISKLDSSGNFVWARALGGTSDDEGYSIILDDSGYVYTTGRFVGTLDFDPGVGTYNLTSAGGADIFISKLDASGNFVWAKTLGGTNDDIAYSLSLDDSSNVYTTGSYKGTADFDPGMGTYNLTSAGSWDVFISKLDVSGNFIWAKSMGGTYENEGYSIALDDSGNVFTTGYFSGVGDFDPGAGTYNLTSTGLYSIFISKLNRQGNFVWAKVITGTNKSYGKSIALDNFGNVYTTGYFYQTADFDPGIDTFNLTSVSDEDIFISKLDGAGNFVWAKSLGGTSDDEGLSIALDASGNVFTTGFFRETADFDPGTGTYYLNSSGNKNVFVSKLDATGNFVYAKAIYGTIIAVGTSLALDAYGNVFTTGFFNGTTTYNSGSGAISLQASGDADIFVCKLSPLSIGLGENDSFNTVNVFPNPSNGKFTIETEVNPISLNSQVSITNALGELIYSSEITNYKSEIDLSAQPKGIYILSIRAGKEVGHRKLIKQ